MYHLHGTVVDGFTGKPLARVLVMSADRRMAVMTGNDGQFAVDLSVPSRSQSSAGANFAQGAGSRRFSQQVYLNLQKPGYVPPDQPQAVTLDDNISSTNIQLKLMPAATITGRISAAGVDSFANVSVVLLEHQSLGDGYMTWRTINVTNTNARGEFHLANLRPGEYTLVTGEWRGDHPLPQRDGEITERYPPTYYGDVSSLDAALKLHLHHGDSLQTELHLDLATYYPVSLPVTNPTPGSAVTARVVNQNPFNSFQLRYNQRSGSIEGLLPNGQYTLLLSSGQQSPVVGSLPQRPAQQPQRSFAQVNLDVAGAPVQTAAVALSPASPISIQVHAQLTQTQASSSSNSGRALAGGAVSGNGAPGMMDLGSEENHPLVQLSLQSEDGAGGYSSTPSQPGHYDELVLQNVPPGHYFVRLQAMRGYVASASYAGVDLLQQPLVVGANGTASPIDVAVRDDNPQVSGTVTSGVTPLPPQIFLILLPTDGAAQFSTSYAGADGKFTVRNLAPGSYRVLALPFRQFQIPYRDPEVMRHYDGKGTTFTASPGQVLSIEVPFLDDANLTDIEGK